MSDEIYRDQPTGLYNRRYLDEVLLANVGAWIQDEEAFTLVMVDLDHFKHVNDQYGHARGDAVLKNFAHFLQEATRSTDHVIRYGGDEFLCVLPNIQRMNAEVLYRRILEKCNDRDFDGLKMTLSIGLASFPSDGMDYQKLFAIADASLYEAKRGGRNRLGLIQKKQIAVPIKAFINRRDEIGTLLNKIVAKESNLRLFVINGNVGVGKSRLTRECLNLVQKYEVIWADCLLFADNIAYYAIRELIKYRMQRRGANVFDGLPLTYRLEIGKLVPEILETVEDNFDHLDLMVDRYRLYEGVHKSFEAGDQAKIIIIDNFQWIDRESVETMRYLARSMKDTSNIFILLNRVEEMQGLALDFLDDVSREVSIDETELGPLTELQVRECVQAIIGDEPEDKLAEYAFRSSGGNPYFLEEVFRGLAAGNYLTLEQDRWRFRVPDGELVPKSIEVITQRKYKLLSVEAQSVMRFASIIGCFDFSMLRHLTGYGESELRGLLSYICRSGVMREIRGKLVFVDEFSRRTIYRKFVTGPVALELHRKVAEQLESDHLGRAAEILDQLAANYYYAGDQAKGLKYCLLAAQRAQEKYANDEAIRYYLWAEQLLSDEQRTTRFDILLARVKLYHQQGMREAQHRDLVALQQLAEGLGDSQRSSDVSLCWADYGEATGDYEAAIAAAQGLIDLARSTNDAAHEAQGHLQLGAALWHRGQYGPAQLELEQSLNLAQASAMRQVEAESLRNLATLFNLHGDFGQAIQYNEQALQIYHEIGYRMDEGRVLNNLGIISMNVGNYLKAKDYLERALHVCQDTGGHRRIVQSVLNDMGMVLHLLGDDDASRQHQLQSLAIAKEINELYGEGYVLTYLAHALVGLGELTEATHAYRQAAALRRKLGQQHLVIDDLEGLARIALLQGDLAQAREQVEIILEYLKTQTLKGSDDPSQIYLTCYRVLQANQDGRARELLTTAHALLQEQAAKLTDEDMRRSFIENVATHQAIVEEFSRIGDAGS